MGSVKVVDPRGGCGRARGSHLSVRCWTATAVGRNRGAPGPGVAACGALDPGDFPVTVTLMLLSDMRVHRPQMSPSVTRRGLPWEESLSLERRPPTEVNYGGSQCR